ncbi:hypothetical protein ES288_D10G097200v1 [Gossypium darwinii]|uniref:Ribulose-phosphate 3-epimerase n=1 Tax=Gossypium darwinii TaxID=34276 RepID=A0A5D2AZY7_GOSDA|nr:hypothetical protein ES288_D10G097200v1 [Gossypium darwinii]
MLNLWVKPVLPVLLFMLKVLIVFMVFILLTDILLWRYAPNLQENWHELIQKIKSKAMRPGVALKPGTLIEEVYPLVDSENPVEMVLVMTVEPGFGGQKFMPQMMDKVRVLRKKYPSLDIENVPIQISDIARKMKCQSNIHGHSCLLKKWWV